MPDFGGIAQGIVGGLLGFAGTVAGNMIGAVMGWLGSVVQGLAIVADGVLQLLPDATDLGLSIPGGWLHGYAWLNGFVPLSELLAFCVILVGVQMAPVIWRLAIDAYHLIPKPWVGT